jgi:solute carrier family 25 (mitochondrial phosphate transporter), member 23/24/25/41
LFIPTDTKTPALKAVLSYYSSAVAVNAEGDTSIREGTYEGLGRPPHFLKSLFGAIVRIAEPPPPNPSFPSRSRPSYATSISSLGAEVDDKMFDFNQAHLVEATLGPTYMDPLLKPNLENGNRSLFYTRVASTKALLIEILPDAGYFFAGGVAGAVSRTATAPLDRLKVYLIAHVDARRPVTVAKQAGIASTVKNVGRPLVVAFQELWKAGRMRSLFAGRSQHPEAVYVKITHA